MELNRSVNNTEIAPTNPVVETVDSVTPPPLESQPAKPAHQAPAQPHTGFEGTTTLETPAPAQPVQPVEPPRSGAPIFDFSPYVEGNSVPADMGRISNFAAAFGQQSMQNHESSPPPIRGAK